MRRSGVRISSQAPVHRYFSKKVVPADPRWGNDREVEKGRDVSLAELPAMLASKLPCRSQE